MEDWSTSYFLPLLSPLFLLFSDRFLPVRPLFCVCFVLLWPVVSIFPGFLSFVRPLCVCLFFPCFIFPQFVPPGVLCVFRSPVVFCSWVFSVLFVLSVRPLVLSVCSQSSGLPPLHPWFVLPLDVMIDISQKHKRYINK